jgi:hypothetical protein
MIIARTVFAASLVFVLLAGCGKSTNAPGSGSAPIAARPDVIVTLDGPHHTCAVALYNEEHGSTVSCDEVAVFMRDELKVPSGSIYEIRTIPDVDESDETKVETSLKGEGYRFIGGPHAAFITGPHTHR